MPHPTTVEGFDGSLQELAQRIHRMRYDKVAEFYRYCDEELVHQTRNDSTRGRMQLANALAQTRHLIYGVISAFDTVWAICKPYEEKEIR